MKISIYSTMKVTHLLAALLLGFASLHGQVAPTDLGHNRIYTVTYDLLGQPRTASVGYFNTLGRAVQSQSWDPLTYRVWNTEIRYDRFGRPALTSLSAPIGTSFGYQSSFIRKENGSTYTLGDFDSTSSIENPAIVGEQNGTLGWYYSNANTLDAYQDITDYPFSRTVYSRLNPGAAKKTIGGNKVPDANGNLVWAQAYSFTMPAGWELSQTVAFGSTAYRGENMRVFKTVVRDVNGVENIVFADSDGNTLAAARSGPVEGPLQITPRSTRVYMTPQGYVDIHLPQGCSGITVTGLATGSFELYDLITESKLSSSTLLATLPSGIYRVAIKNFDSWTGSINSIYITHTENYYDYSLNYYDKAGRLIKSTQPLSKTQASTFTYNTLGQLYSATSPDEGTALFAYRKDGQIRYSQNSLQASKTPKEVSYTDYDDYGRPRESGVLVTPITDFTTFYNNPDGPRPIGQIKEGIRTYYDLPAGTGGVPSMTTVLGPLAVNYKQEFLSGNVSASSTFYFGSNSMLFSENFGEENLTWYSYDIYGRVSWVVQWHEGLGAKTLDYTYDPVTGQVTSVDYQRHTPTERFVHRYTYDIKGQLTKVETSKNGSTWTEQAEYRYTEAGALKRIELADKLQGIDYVYNLAGQLKGINNPLLTPSKDPGNDGTNGTLPDVFGMGLDYHSQDYLRSNTPTPVESFEGGQHRIDGAMKAQRWNVNIPLSNGKVLAWDYRYNRNNWLTDALYGTYTKPSGGGATDGEDITFNGVVLPTTSKEIKASRSITLGPGFYAGSGSTFSAKIVVSQGGFEEQSGDYQVSGITYDANGNIQKLNRNKHRQQGSNQMDQLTYTYRTDKPNQLDHVNDAVVVNTQADDIKDQAAGNYVYDLIGRMIENKAEGLKYTYNTSGLVTEVRKNNILVVKFYYNDRNHRVRKERYNPSNGALQETTYYVRDVAGVTLAVYTKQAGQGIVLEEHSIYGSSRLGVHKRASGTDLYAITDHLGNVRAVIAKNGNNALSLTNATDYYPFGMPMPGRSLTDGQYRYAFQGQEKDPETGMEAFELRLWDSRIGRWLTVDPAGQFSSPYVGMANQPTIRIDPDGGCVVGIDCPEEFNWMEEGTEVLDEIVMTPDRELPLLGMKWFSDSVTGGGTIDFSQFQHSSVFIGKNMVQMLQTTNSEAALNAYRDLAQGTIAEWKISHHDENQYTLATRGSTGFSPSNEDMGLESSVVHYSIHSHSNTSTTKNGDWGDGVGFINGIPAPQTGDWSILRKGGYDSEKRTFIYYPYVDELYEYTKHSPRISVQGGLNSLIRR